MRHMLILTGFLAACSGAETGTTTGAGTGGGGTTPGAFAAILGDISARQADFDAFASGSGAFTAPNDLPESGTATYSGLVSLSDGSGYALAGSVDVIADWDCCEVTGRVYDIVTQDDESLRGELDITHGEIDMTGDPNVAPIVRADVIGTLSSDAGAHVSDEFDPLLLEGNFVGPTYDWFQGTIAGPITAPDGTHDVTGDLLGER
ncbi:hypothetical protein ACP2AV_09205 [Aliiroseovarius sp. PTFE2010]|uniref:hypothetical protein n=1 Tax=Aliiroseovarius sp. PTFE2010 TaxID=3417190 RepID=UPI003CF07C7F